MDFKKKFLLDYYQNYTSFSLEEIEQVIDHYEYIEIEKDQLLQKSGQFSKFSYIVMEGILVNYVYDYNGKKAVINFAPERHWAGGGVSYNHEGMYTQSLEPTKLLRIKYAILEHWYENNQKFAFVEVKLVRNAFKALKLRMLESISKPAIYNYERLLIKFPGIEHRVPQKYIASYLGVTPQFFSKMRAEYLKNKA